MAITKSQKEKMLNDLSAELDDAKLLVLFNYSGLKSNFLSDFRKNVADKNCYFKVVKNRLLKLWAERNNIQFDEKSYDYPTAVLAVNEEVAELAKLFMLSSKENNFISFKSALLDFNVIDKDAVKKLSELPSKDVLISQLLSSINAPRQNLVRCLNHPLSSIVHVLYKIKENKKEEA